MLLLDQVEIKGQRDKQIILIEKLFNEMSTFKINPERFDKIKEKVRSVYY